ncbi:MAG: XkdX family protein [Lachnospiraceae bacterium]|nr:XkdX family protein [Lachnospiraceae bacterium]
MSSNYTKVRNYYRLKMWSIDRVRNAVVTGWITEEEFTLITGEDY